MRKVIFIAMAALAPVFIAGCQSGADQSLFEQLKVSQEQQTKLALEVESLEKANAELTEEIETLTSIGRKIRLEVLERIVGIEIAKRTGLYDKNDDGRKESLVVYVRTIDDAGDAVKAAGSVDVQLWDLEKEQGALLAEWKVAPEELKVLWASTVMTSYFRMTFDISEVLGPDMPDELTVKVTFTDYITGTVLRKQMVIKP